MENLSIHRWIQIALMILCSALEISYADAKGLAMPAEDPKPCVEPQALPCAISTGDQPRMFQWGSSQWEFDRHSVMEVKSDGLWNFYQGMAVVEATKPLRIHTAFADILIENGKAMIHILDDKVRVLALLGLGVKVIPRHNNEEHFLVPGFQNWYAGIGLDGQEVGVPSVIDLRKFSVKRSEYFLDHRLGFAHELYAVANSVKWATRLAAKMNQELVERKVASLQEAHESKVRKKTPGNTV